MSYICIENCIFSNVDELYDAEKKHASADQLLRGKTLQVQMQMRTVNGKEFFDLLEILSIN